MSKFHNPYHFVPVKKRTEADKQHDLLVDKARNCEWGGHSHAAYGKGLNSGRLVCRIETETPIFVGGRHSSETDNQAKLIEPFLLNNEPAIPASSLRGLFSSIAEAASNSALRVLHRDRILSYRKPFGDYLSALGMIIKDGNNLMLRPLTLPNLKGDQKNGYSLGPGFSQIFSNPNYNSVPLKVYLNNYRFDRTSKAFNKHGFLASNPKSFNINNPKFYYMNLSDQRGFSIKNGKLVFSEFLKTKPTKEKEHVFCLGQRPLSDDVIDVHKNSYVRGIIYVLGIDGRKNMIDTKKHELFIPYPESIEKAPLLQIPDSVIETFKKLADERYADSVDKNGKQRKGEDLYPYSPFGCERNENNKELGLKLRLKHGDIVYFAPNATGTEVAEVSFSSIWRGAAGHMEDYFNKIDPELLPFNSQRKRITPAELLFGFVQDEKGDASLAYKGKVRLSNAVLAEGQEDPFTKQEVTLKILSSPKPPSPALYFKPVGNPKGGYITKASLKPDSSEPQGRKVYLHHNIKEGQTPWKTDKDKELLNQKNRIKPLRSKLFFKFSIDFDNLTDWELGLLCYSVRPDSDFRHKIGLGKPLGLGTVRVDPEALEVVDRAKRYSPEGFMVMRHEPASFDTYRSIFTKGMDAQIANALNVLGNPAKVKLPVHTPQVEGIGLEEETFKWFVANDVGSGNKNRGNRIEAVKCCLRPISADDLPALDRLEFAHEGAPLPGGGKHKDGHKHHAGHHKPGPGNKPHHGGDKNPESTGGDKFSNNAFAALAKLKK